MSPESLKKNFNVPLFVLSGLNDILSLFSLEGVILQVEKATK